MNDDVQLTTDRVIVTQISPSSDLQPFPITFTFRPDRVAQERDENFTITIEFNSIFLGTAPKPRIRDRMTGIIQDNNGELYNIPDVYLRA